MAKVLLDTHVWIWVSIEDRTSISRKALMVIEQASEKWISAISCWELAKLVERKRISFSIPTVTWINRSLVEYDVQVAELSPEVTVESTMLPGLHRAFRGGLSDPSHRQVAPG